MKWFQGFRAEVDVNDRKHVEIEKSRNVPFSISPFRPQTPSVSTLDFETGLPPVRPDSVTLQPVRRRHGKPSPQESEEAPADSYDDEPVGDRPPEWLELASDLAWTATFSSLTSNTSISSPSNVVSYGVFFVLAWHLWATQVVYDTRYFTHDWWHRLFFIFQLTVYASLSAFSGSFNVYWGLNQSGTMPFIGNVTSLTAVAIKANAEVTLLEAFEGVNIIIAVNRLMLFAQYCRVLYYRYRFNCLHWRHTITPITTAAASLIFFGSFINIHDRAQSQRVAITQLCLWALAILIQILGHVVTPDDPKFSLRSVGSLTTRLSVLTVIVLGEGLNGICQTLRHTVNSLGLTGASIGNACAVGGTLYLIWLLYFDGFRVRLPPGKIRQESFVWLHLPFHLSLILTLEGLKNVFLYVNILEAMDVFIRTFQSFTASHSGLVVDPSMNRMLAKIGLSWDQEVMDITNATKNGLLATEIQLWQWMVTAVHDIILFYVDTPDSQSEYLYNEYITNATYVAQDVAIGATNGTTPFLTQFIDSYDALLGYSVKWLLSVTGMLLFLMGTINTTQRRPRDRFAWGSSLTLKLAGVLLLLLGQTSSGRKPRSSLTWTVWLIPTIAIILAATALVNEILLAASIRSIHKTERESGAKVVTPSTGVPGPLDPAFPSPLTPKEMSTGEAGAPKLQYGTYVVASPNAPYLVDP